MNNYSSNQGSDNSAVFGIIGGVCAFVVLLCWIQACARMSRRQDGSQTSQAAPAAANGGSAEKDGHVIIDVTDVAVSTLEIAAEVERAGGGGASCCCGGGGCGDGGGCGGCGGD